VVGWFHNEAAVDINISQTLAIWTMIG
jgi:hypothetical protein